MSRFFEVEHKLQMADYLLSRGPGFQDAAIKHVVEAANDLITTYLNLGQGFIGPVLASKKLATTEETKIFANEYAQFWKYPVQGPVSHDVALNAYKVTKAFLELVKKTRGSA